jgi:hypothetical protein
MQWNEKLAPWAGQNLWHGNQKLAAGKIRSDRGSLLAAGKRDRALPARPKQEPGWCGPACKQLSGAQTEAGTWMVQEWKWAAPWLAAAPKTETGRIAERKNLTGAHGSKWENWIIRARTGRKKMLHAKNTSSQKRNQKLWFRSHNTKSKEQKMNSTHEIEKQIFPLQCKQDFNFETQRSPPSLPHFIIENEK